MIEIKNVEYFLYMRRNNIPYFIFFYKKDGDEIKDYSNLILIKYIRSIEKSYCDLPMIAFDYSKFIKYYLHIKISSCNDVLVSQGNKPDKIYEKPSNNKIIEILKQIRQERILSNKNSGLKRPYSETKPWFIHAGNRRIGYVSIKENERIRNQNIFMGIKEDDIITDITEKDKNDIEKTNISLKRNDKLILVQEDANSCMVKKFTENSDVYHKFNETKNSGINQKYIQILNTKDFFNFPPKRANIDIKYVTDINKSNILLQNYKDNNHKKIEGIFELSKENILTPSSLLNYNETHFDIQNYENTSTFHSNYLTHDTPNNIKNKSLSNLKSKQLYNSNPYLCHETNFDNFSKYKTLKYDDFIFNINEKRGNDSIILSYDKVNNTNQINCEKKLSKIKSKNKICKNMKSKVIALKNKQI